MTYYVQVFVKMKKIIDKILKIKLLILDVDGVLTDGNLYYSDTGTDIKTFHVQDGLGIRMLQNSGIEIGVITGHNSPLIQIRMQALKVPHIYQGQEHKQNAFEELLNKLNLAPEQACYFGDDLPDLPLMRRAGFAITVPNVTMLAKKEADWITTAPGGCGAVREVCELIMRVQETQHEQLIPYLN